MAHEQASPPEEQGTQKRPAPPGDQTNQQPAPALEQQAPPQTSKPVHEANKAPHIPTEAMAASSQTPGPHPGRANRGLPTEEIISWILRLGVFASAICIVLGLILLFATSNTGYSEPFDKLTHLVQYSSGANGRFPTTPGEVFFGLAQFKPYALIALGLLLLIATPVFRVAASIIIFLLERDYAYVFITALVLLILIVSFLLGKAG